MVYFQKLFWRWYFSRNCFQKRSKYENFTKYGAGTKRNETKKQKPFVHASLILMTSLTATQIIHPFNSSTHPFLD